MEPVPPTAVHYHIFCTFGYNFAHVRPQRSTIHVLVPLG